MRVGVDIDIAGAGGSVTHILRVRAVMVRNSVGACRSGMKKTVPRRALLGIKAIVYLLGTCYMVDILFYNKGKKAQDCDLISDKSQ